MKPCIISFVLIGSAHYCHLFSINYPFPCTCILYWTRRPLPSRVEKSLPLTYRYLYGFYFFFIKPGQIFFMSKYDKNIRCSGQQVHCMIMSWFITYSETFLKPIRLFICICIWDYIFFFLNVHWFKAYIILYSLNCQRASRRDMNFPEILTGNLFYIEIHNPYWRSGSGLFCFAI